MGCACSISLILAYRLLSWRGLRIEWSLGYMLVAGGDGGDDGGVVMEG
jgi:hypothetical protein